MDTTDTNDPKVSKLTSVPLGNLIGAPLLAIVQGQTQAAQATAEFIERIGFDDTDAPPGQLGKLRTVTFSYQKNVENNEVQTFKVEIPLLSMVTVPGIQVSNASLEYSIKVADIQSTKTTTALSSEATGSSWLAPKRVEFNSTIGSLENTRSSVQTSLQMKIKMEVEQAPVPGGLSFLYNLMEQSVQQSIVPPTPPLDYLPASEVVVAYGSRQMSSQRSGAIMRVQRSSDQTSQQVNTLAEAFTFGGKASIHLRQLYNQANNNLDTWLETTADVAPELTNGGIFYNQQHFMQTNKVFRWEEGFDVYTVGGFLNKPGILFHYLYYLLGIGSITRFQKQDFTYSNPGNSANTVSNKDDSTIVDPVTTGKTVFVQTIRADELKIFERESNELRLLVNGEAANFSFPIENKLYLGAALNSQGNVTNPYLYGYVDAIIITKPLSEQARRDFANLLHQFYVA